MRTLQAVRQVIYAALTSPQVTYQINNASPITLPVANVASRPVWTPAVGGDGTPPSPYVCFAVGGGGFDQLLAERTLRMQLWVSSNSTNLGAGNGPDDEVTELYEAIRAILHGADDEQHDEWLVMPPPSLSRTATAQRLGVTMRRCREMSPGALPAEWEPKSARWYVSAHYSLSAV